MASLWDNLAGTSTPERTGYLPLMFPLLNNLSHKLIGKDFIILDEVSISSSQWVKGQGDNNALDKMQRGRFLGFVCYLFTFEEFQIKLLLMKAFT